MPRECLCDNNNTLCQTCAADAREQWFAFAAAHPASAPGQLLEQAIQHDRAAVVLGILHIVDLDINQPCDPRRYDSVSPFMTALRAGSVLIVSLIARQPQFNLAQSMPPYEQASWVRTASLQLLQQYLATPGSNVNQADGNGKTLLHEVVYDLASQEKLTTLLAIPGIVIDPKQVDGTTPLYRAALAGNTAAFTRMLSHGADINNRNNDNRWTILICAAAQNQISIAEQALRCPGIDVNAVDDLHNTALHIAAERGHDVIVRLLLEHPGIEVNLQNHMGWTPLSKAAFAGHTLVVGQLLALPELDVNRVDQDRQTSLFHATSTNNLETVRLLLADPRINPSITNRPSRLTAGDMARALGFAEVAHLLQQHNAGTDELSRGDPYPET